jgi:transcriptional regulator with XRE-family HTH domain
MGMKKKTKGGGPIEPRALREGLGYSRADVAYTLSVAASTVAGWENGHRMPSAAQLARLAEVYNLNAEQSGRLLLFFAGEAA